MNVRVLLFAGLRDLFKQGELNLSLPEGSTIKELKEELFLRFEKGSEKLKTTQFAVNQTYADLKTKLRDGDEVAFLPMVSGG